MAALTMAGNAAAAAALAAVLLAVGARARQLLRLPTSPRLRWPVDLALGAWAASIPLLLIGLAGFLRRPALLAVMAALALGGRWRGARRPWSAALAPAIGGALFLPVALAPPFFYDAMVYHLALPWRALVTGAWRAHPETVFAAFPPLHELLALPALACGLDRVPALLHWLAWVAAAVGVVGLARRAGAPPTAARLAGGATLLLPVTPLVPGFPAAEAWLLVGLVPAVALSTTRARPGTAPLAGGLLGVAAAARLQGLPWALLVLGLAALRWRPRARRTAQALGGFIVGALPWWGANLALLHDPLAPLGWRREGLETLWRDSMSYLQQGRSPLQCLAALPRLLSGELAWILPLALLAVLAVRQRPRTAAPLAAACVLGAAAWSCTGALPRFLAPTAVLLLAVAAVPGRSRTVRVTATVALGWCALLGVARGAAWLDRIDVGRLIVSDRRGAAASLGPNDPSAAFERSAALPTGARVLFVAEPRAFGFPRPCVVPSQHDPSPLRDLVESGSAVEDIRGRLLDEGYTHLLVNWRELGRLQASYPVAPWRSVAGKLRWLELLRVLGEPVVSEGGVQVFALETDGPFRRGPSPGSQ